MKYEKYLITKDTTSKKVNEARTAFKLDEYMADVVHSVNWRSWKIGNWTFDLDYMSGSWRWDNLKDNKSYVYASPFFDGMEGLPVQVHNLETDDAIKHWTEPFAVTGNPKKDIEAYLSTMKKILSKVR